MSTLKELAECKVSVVMKPKENFIQSVFKDLVTFSFIAFCIYISQNSTWWTFITGGMFMIFFFIKLGNAINKNANVFDNADDAIKHLEESKQ